MSIYSRFKVMVMGENAVLVEVSDRISRKANSFVLALMKKLEEKAKELDGILELVPAYTTLLINYDPKKVSVESLVEIVRECEGEIRYGMVEEIIGKRRTVEIPVVYGGEFGPDLKFIAEYSGLSESEVVELHSSQVYLVYMIGFTPGFAYMGEVPDVIAVPRLEKPRLRVPAGSVGIAGKQTGIYSVESPGGWRIIGRTPIKLFDPTLPKPTLLNAGDLVKFKPITRKEYEELLRVGIDLKGKIEVKCEATFQILSAGPGVTIQDIGRIGFRRYGVPFSGALDKKSFMIANILVGNNINSACIEVFRSSLSLRVLRDTVIALTGAEVYATINEEEIPIYQAVKVRRNDELSIQQFIRGQVAYIAVAGGIEEPMFLGSRSYYLRAGIGRMLRKNDLLYTGRIEKTEVFMDYPARSIPDKFRSTIGNEIKLRVILGPHDNYFSEEMVKDFFESTFRVTSQIDRMGFRLEKLDGEIFRGTGRLISCGTMPGAIQIPPDGNPIILMADAQTTGGYPIIGTVISCDLDVLAQAKPETIVKFEKTSTKLAVKKYLENLRLISNLQSMINVRAKKFLEKHEYLLIKFDKKIFDAWIGEE